MSTETLNEAAQYLSFTLADEIFALDITKVREVLEYTEITRIPKMPAYMCGVINLRGGVVPVVDMRLKLGMPEAERTIETCIIITDVKVDGISVTIGAMADSVSEVFDLDTSQVEPSPSIGTQVKADFLMGMGKHEDNFVLLLDIDKTFSFAELASIKKVDAGIAEGHMEYEENGGEVPGN